MGSKKPQKGPKAAVKLGRPPTPAAIIDEGLELVRGGMSPEEAAEEMGRRGRPVSWRTLRRAGAKSSGVEEPAATPTPPSAPAPSSPAPAPQAGAAIPLPQGGTIATRPDILPLVRRILGKRDPAALAELDAGLIVATRSEPELAAWLDRPLEGSDAEQDPAKALERALAAATLHAEQLPPLHPRAATILGVVGTLGTKLENVTKGRPREEKPDEVTARLQAAKGTAVAKMLPRIAAAEAKLAADRRELEAWARGAFGELGAVEMLRRVDAMMGGTPS